MQFSSPIVTMIILKIILLFFFFKPVAMNTPKEKKKKLANYATPIKRGLLKKRGSFSTRIRLFLVQSTKATEPLVSNY